MLSVVLRAEAYLALGRTAEAAKEWNKISEYPGNVQLSATAPISKLRIARVFAAQARNSSTSAQAQVLSTYQAFLNLWRDADPDIRILKEARAEFAALK